LATYGSELIAGGQFGAAGTVSADRIAAWDGEAWHALGDGVSGLAQGNRVRALAILDGDLVAGGAFTTAGGAPAHAVARWNGSEWQPLAGSLDGEIYSLAVYRGTLYAGGGLTADGGLTYMGLARWDGSSWLDAGLDGGALALAVDASGSELAAGGTFVR